MDIIESRSKETKEFIDTLAELTVLIKNAFIQRTPILNGEKYLTNAEICEILHISQRTLQDYRDTGKIGYIQIAAGKILYKESDILKMLEDNYVPKHNNVR